MKKLLIALVITILLFAAALGFVLYRAKDIVALFKPTIEQKLSAVVGAKVSIGELSLSILPKTEIEAKNIAIQGASTQQDGLSVGTLLAKAKLGPLLSKQLEISELRIVSPSITVVRDVSGTYVVGVKPETRPTSSSSTQPPVTAPRVENPASEEKGFTIDVQKISIDDGTLTFDDRIRGEKFPVSHLNLSAAVDVQGETVQVPVLNVSASVLKNAAVSLDSKSIVFDQTSKALSFGESLLSLPGGKLSAEGNLGREGSVRVRSGSLDIGQLVSFASQAIPSISRYSSVPLTVTDLQAEVGLSQMTLVVSKLIAHIAETIVPISGHISLDTLEGQLTVSSSNAHIAELLSEVKKIFPVPALNEVAVDGEVSSNVIISLFGAKGYKVEGPVSLKAGSLKPKSGPALSNIGGDLDFSLTPSQQAAEKINLKLTVNGEIIGVKGSLSTSPVSIQSPSLSVEAFGGQSSLSFSYPLLEGHTARIQARGERIDLTKLFNVVKPDFASRVTGTITSFNNDLKVEIGAPFLSSLNGVGLLVIEKGAFKNFNLPRAVLEKVDNLPFVEGSLSRRIPQKYSQMLSRPETPINQVMLSYSVNHAVANLSRFSLDSDFCALESVGAISLTDSALNLNSIIYFSKEFSADLATDIKELKNVIASDGRLTIPLHITGVPPGLIVVPDTRKVIELAGKGVLKEKAASVLDKALGKSSPGKEGTRKALESILGF